MGLRSNDIWLSWPKSVCTIKDVKTIFVCKISFSMDWKHWDSQRGFVYKGRQSLIHNWAAHDPCKTWTATKENTCSSVCGGEIQNVLWPIAAREPNWSTRKHMLASPKPKHRMDKGGQHMHTSQQASTGTQAAGQQLNSNSQAAGQQLDALALHNLQHFAHVDSTWTAPRYKPTALHKTWTALPQNLDKCSTLEAPNQLDSSWTHMCSQPSISAFTNALDNSSSRPACN